MLSPGISLTAEREVSSYLYLATNTVLILTDTKTLANLEHYILFLEHYTILIFRLLGFVLSSGARYFPSPEIVACDMIMPNKSRSLKRCVMLQNPSPIAIWFCFHYVRITYTYNPW